MGLHKRIINIIITVLVLLNISISDSWTQENTKGTDIYASPRITLGYTFGGGLNYGFDIALGLYRLNDFNFGTNFSYYMVNTDQGHHRIKGFMLMAETKYLSVKLGAGAVSRRWGLRNVNKTSAPGIIIDITASADAYRAPWVGVKSFIYKRSKWLFYDQPSYISGYTYFKTQEIDIYRLGN